MIPLKNTTVNHFYIIFITMQNILVCYRKVAIKCHGKCPCHDTLICHECLSQGMHQVCGVDGSTYINKCFAKCQ